MTCATSFTTSCAALHYIVLLIAVNDMFFNTSYSLDANDQECVEKYGIHAQYNWAAYRCGHDHAGVCIQRFHKTT